MPFYKKQEGELLVSEFVDGQGYVLSGASKDEHVYPVDGWYWFEDLDKAMAVLSKVEQDAQPSLTPRQLRLKLLSIGLLDEVEALCSADRAMNIWFEYSLDFQRSNEMLNTMGTQLGMSEDAMDSFFIEASKL